MTAMTTLDSNGRAHHSKGTPQSLGGQFAAQHRADGDVSLNPLAAKAPAEIDREIYEAEVRAHTLRAQAAPYLRYIDDIDEYHRRLEVGLDERYLRLKHHLADPDGARRAEYRAKAEPFLLAARAIQEDEIDPREEEFGRRPWSRFYLVVSSDGGHVHSSIRCSTCRPSTRFVLLFDESGKDEAGIIERAGDGACTVCFPNAPVADAGHPRKNTFESPEQKAAREEREAAKAAREAKRQATGIFAADGSVLRMADRRPYINDNNPGQLVTRHLGGAEIKTERTAEITLVDLLIEYPTQQVPELPADVWNRDRRMAEAEASVESIGIIVEALARKRGLDPDAVLEAAKIKAAAKQKKRGW